MKLAEAEKALTEAKAKTAEAKATLETEIAKLEALKLKAKVSQRRLHSCLRSLQNLLKQNNWKKQFVVNRTYQTRKKKLVATNQFVMNQLKTK